MIQTSLTLLEGLKRNDNQAWQRFEKVYRPVISSYLSQVLHAPAEIDEVYADVITELHRKIAGFERQREGSFWAYLRSICYFKLKECRRRRRWLPGTGPDSPAPDLEEVADPRSPLNQKFEEEHRRIVTEFALAEARRRCGDWAVEFFVAWTGKPKSQSNEDFAEEWGLTRDKFYDTRGKVLRALENIRKEWGDLFDS